MEVLMKLSIFVKTLALFAIALFIVAADYITRDMIPEGTDVSTIRCSASLVSVGDFSRDVLKKCGEPIRETRFLDEPYRVWVYRLGQENHVVYFSFIDEKLERIYDVKCSHDNPDCE
jgi:hypothetical protein